MSTFWLAVKAEGSATLSMTESGLSTYDQEALEKQFAEEMSALHDEADSKQQVLIEGMRVSHLTEC